MVAYKRLSIEKYFEFLNNQAKCKLCSRLLKGNRCFNLKIHLKNVHKVKESELMLNCRKDGDHTKFLLEQSIKQEAIKIKITKTEFLRSCIGLVTEDSIPFNILDAENFHNIIDPICRGLTEKFGKKMCLNSNSCKEVLQLISENIRNEIRSNLYQRAFSLKIDSATGLSRNIFGISAQFIKDSKIQFHMLGVINIKDGRSMPQQLATEILGMLNKFDINPHQIISMTLDNYGNTMPTISGSPNDRALEDENEDQNFWDGNDIYLRKIQMLTDSSKIEFNEIRIYGCTAHTAQLCMLDMINDSYVKSNLLTSRNLVKFISKPSNGYCTIFEPDGLSMPQLDCPTKWGSTYSMINALKNSKDILNNIKSVSNKSMEENFELNASFWKFIEAYCIVFEPLQQAIMKFIDEQLHYGDFYAQWLKCRLCTEKLLEKSSNMLVQNMCKSLLSSMESRTKSLLTNEGLLSCLYLDPRFNHTLTPTQSITAITYLKNLYERAKNIKNTLNQEIKMEPSTSCTETTEFSERADEYLNEYLTRNFVASSNEEVEIYTKLENLQMPFVRVDSNVLQFWRDKQYSDPELYALSNICFAVPATHVSAEDTFTTLDLILVNNRNSVDKETLDNVLIINLNNEFLDKAIETLTLFEEDS